MAGVDPIDLQRLSETVLGLVSQVAEIKGLITFIGKQGGIIPKTNEVGDQLLRMFDADRYHMDRIEWMISSFQTELRSEYALTTSVRKAIEVHISEMVDPIAKTSCTYEDSLAPVRTGFAEVQQDMNETKKEVHRIQDACTLATSPGRRGEGKSITERMDYDGMTSSAGTRVIGGCGASSSQRCSFR